MNLPNTIAGWAIWVVALIAIVALVYLAANAMGIGIPPWVITAFWIIIIAGGIMLAIRIVAGMGGQQP